jgi:hypothetical protein
MLAGFRAEYGTGREQRTAAYFQQLTLASEEGEVKAVLLHTPFSSKEEKHRVGKEVVE